MGRKKIFVIVQDAGAGHRSAANGLKETIQKRELPWDVRILNPIQEISPKSDLTKRFFGFGREDFYNFYVRHNLLTLIRMSFRITHFILRRVTPHAIKIVREFMSKEKPDMVVSVMPWCNDILASALEGLKIPFGIVLTDLKDIDPPFWFTPEACRTARFVGVPSAEAQKQALERGASKKQFIECGLIIHPKYFDPEIQNTNRAAMRSRFGLEPNLFTLLIARGGIGGRFIHEVIDQCEKAGSPWQIIACCGKDEKLKTNLERLKGKLKNRVFPIGFTSELHLLMKASDVLVTKPGATTMWEALAMHTPMIFDVHHAMPQEIPNADFIVRNRFGIPFKKKSEIFGILEDLFSHPDKIEAIRNQMRAFKMNNATDRIVDRMIESLKE